MVCISIPIIILFQFQKVRLKGFTPNDYVDDGGIFQFQKVRLKGYDED